MGSELLGKVFRHTVTDELLWVVGKDDDPTKWPDGAPYFEYIVLCLTGHNTGKTRRARPDAITEWCELVSANYDNVHPRTLAEALLEGLVAV